MLASENVVQFLPISVFAYLLYRCVAAYLKALNSPLRDLAGPPSLTILRGSFKDTSEGDGYRTLEQWAKEYGNTFVFRSLLSVSTLCLHDVCMLSSGTHCKPFARPRKSTP